MADAGYIYVVQNQLSGTLDVIAEPGVFRRMPFFSTVTTYPQIMTVSFEDSAPDDDGSSAGSMFNRGNDNLIVVRFADTYAGKISCSFRFKLPVDPDKCRKMHKEFRSAANLKDTLLARNAKNVVVITATQYTGEEFFQGGLNQFKNQLTDQLNNGIYETVRKQVEVEQSDLAPVGLGQSDGRKIQATRQLVWKTVPVLNSQGRESRMENPLQQYGIFATQVLLADPRPEPTLNKLLEDKKRLVADRIKAVQEQETAKAQAKTEQMKKEIERTRAVQDAQRGKELAVIGQEREVEIAKQVAEREVVEQNKLLNLARIQKDKELAIANANFNIQKANSNSSIFEAKAIAAKGRAEADVLSAMYRAKAQNKEVYLAEVQRDIAASIYSNLKDFKVEMPHNYIGGGGNSGHLTSNLDVITGFSALGVMEKSAGLGGFGISPPAPRAGGIFHK